MEKDVTMNPIIIHPHQIAETLKTLQDAGHQRCECVVLWLGVRNETNIEVREVYVPEQYAESDFFRIPRAAMADLLRYLRKSRYMIAAQVHSHPYEAFHSHVDDEWAIVRHQGALSLVLPDFGLKTTSDTFVKKASVFRLSADNEWLEVLPNYVTEYYFIAS